jgi:hypothetical protein
MAFGNVEERLLLIIASERTIAGEEDIGEDTNGPNVCLQ